MKQVTSEKLYERASRLIPGGVNSPVRAFRSVGGTPLFMKKGEGPFITDVDDNVFIDYCMSWGPLILGHADADVVKALQETAVMGTSFGTPHPYEIDLAELIVDSYDSMEKVRFVNSGTEATMSAIRLARGYTGRERIIKFDGCYHGHADFLLACAGSGVATLGIPDTGGVTRGAAMDTIVLPYNNSEVLEKFLAEQGQTIAAVILEPLPCNYGMIPPAEGFLELTRKCCDEHGIVLIFDEVINGFRLGRGGAQEYYGVNADLTTLGKIIGGGLPVGAYGGKREIMDTIAPEGPVYQAGTLSGNPLAMASGIATLKKLFSEGYGILKNTCPVFNRLMQEALEPYKGKVLFQQVESIFTFTFTDRTHIASLDDVKSGNMKHYARFHREMLERGIYLAPSGYEVGFLSAAHSEENIRNTVEAVKASVQTVLGE